MENTEIGIEVISSKESSELDRIISSFAEKNRLYIKIWDQLLEAVIIHNSDRIIFVNKSGLRLLRITALDDIVNENLSDFISYNNMNIGIEYYFNDFTISYPQSLARDIGKKANKKALNVKIKTEYINISEDNFLITFLYENTNNNIQLKDGKQQNIYQKNSIHKKLDSRFDLSINVLDIANINNKLKKFSTLFEVTKDIILFVNSHGKIIEANNSALKSYGYDREELFSKKIQDLRATNTIKLIKEQMTIAKNGGVCFETIHKHKDGHEFTVEVSSIGVEINGEKVLCSIIRDISSRKKLELELDKSSEKLYKLQEYEKKKFESIANISHEFRTPLNVILSAIQLLSIYSNNNCSIEKYEEKVKYNLAIMKQNSRRLLKLINNIIDITNIEGNMCKLNLGHYDIVREIENLTLFVADYAKNKGIEVTFDTDEEEKIVVCDIQKIEKVIFNLLSNAIKFTKQGGLIEVTVNCSNSDVTVSINDNGQGIDDDDFDRIFDRFSSVNKYFTRNSEGCGLGLFLTKSLVELHGGNISVKSSIGKGSKFTFNIPLIASKENKENINYKFVSRDVDEILENLNIEFSDIYDIFSVNI
ncbi:PAS domain-containing sensor histidine kinase [Clostridium sp. OS1-26]|uniref:sensor histidine kinase n=1 Tax=Clostridium sp. OS1-26 TaxID=3070681 RepID=UPI0027E17CD7|nr:PAS domain-containing sensor histidine kinase [Clostridium sp. OS1-26]WML34744.1 PAS domain-containing sensor histidine kinase [Clostridium sp. OS1-26]